MKLLIHPERFREGTRVLTLATRNKDGASDKRRLTRVTHSAERFTEALYELESMARPGERIYGSADARCLVSAARHFRHAQIEAEHTPDPADFYRHLQSRWESSLMQPTSREGKNWLFDCDSAAIFASLTQTLAAAEVPKPYVYMTKSGHHIVTRPFDRRILSVAEFATLHDNALLLWGFFEETPNSTLGKS